MKNVWTDRLRAAGPEETSGEEHPAFRAAADPRTPLGGVEDAQIRGALEAAMAHLPRAQREALHLFYWDDLSVEEVAQALSVPEGTVKTLLFRGRRRTHQKWGRGALNRAWQAGPPFETHRVARGAGERKARPSGRAFLPSQPSHQARGCGRARFPDRRRSFTMPMVPSVISMDFAPSF